MYRYDVKSCVADEFINDGEILDTLKYAKENSTNRELISAIIKKAALCKGLSHREAAVLLDCSIPEENEKIFALAKKIKEIIDTQSAFSDWLNNQRVRDKLKQDIKICLIKNGYPPQYSPAVFQQIMGQVENFKEHEV